jgi:hypothetical protein
VVVRNAVAAGADPEVVLMLTEEQLIMAALAYAEALKCGDPAVAFYLGGRAASSEETVKQIAEFVATVGRARQAQEN